MADEEIPSTTQNAENNQTSADTDVITEEIVMVQSGRLKYYFNKIMYKIAVTGVGRTILGMLEYSLKVLEETAKWSLPVDDSDFQLHRLLPWIFFLMLIIWLRFIRLGLSLIAYIFNTQRVTPHSIINYLQNKRHQLTDFRLCSLRFTTNNEQANRNSNQNVSFLSKIKNRLWSLICRPTQRGRISPTREQLNAKASQDMDDSDLYFCIREMFKTSDSDSEYGPQNLEGGGDEEEKAVEECLLYILEEVGEEEGKEKNDEVNTEVNIDSSSFNSEHSSEIFTKIIRDSEMSENHDNEITEKNKSRELSDTDTATEGASMDASAILTDLITTELEEQNEEENVKNAESEQVVASEKLSPTKDNSPLKEEDKEKTTPENESAAATTPPLQSDNISVESEKLLPPKDNSQILVLEPLKEEDEEKSTPDQESVAAATPPLQSSSVTYVESEKLLPTEDNSQILVLEPLKEEDEGKSTPDHESVAAATPPLQSSSVTYGSPQDSELFFKDSPNEAYSPTPTESEKFESTSPVSSPPQQTHNPNSNKGNRYHQNSRRRYNKNRPKHKQ